MVAPVEFGAIERFAGFVDVVRFPCQVRHARATIEARQRSSRLKLPDGPLKVVKETVSFAVDPLLGVSGQRLELRYRRAFATTMNIQMVEHIWSLALGQHPEEANKIDQNCGDGRRGLYRFTRG